MKFNEFINELKTRKNNEGTFWDNNPDNHEFIDSYLKSIKNDPIKFRNHFELISKIMGPDGMYEQFYDEVVELYVPYYGDDEDAGVYEHPMYYAVFANYIRYDGIPDDEIHENYEAKDITQYVRKYC